MAVGKGKILENGKVRPIDLGVGDRMLFGTYSGTEVKVAGEELIVAREEVRFSEVARPGSPGVSAGARRGGLESAPPNPICAVRCS